MLKKSCLALFWLLTLSLSLLAQEISFPPYAYTNNGCYVIKKVTRTSKDTRFCLQLNYRPHWWVMFDSSIVLRDVDTGKEYQLRGLLQEKMDSRIFLPESGTKEVTLIFDPISPEVHTVDFLEPDGWKTHGIDLSQSHQGSAHALPYAYEGNWYDPEGEQGWVAGIYRNHIILDDVIWDYQEVRSFKTHYEVDLAQGKNTCTLVLSIDQDHLYLTRDGRYQQRLTAKPNTRRSSFPTLIDPLTQGYTLFQGYLDHYNPTSGLSTAMVMGKELFSNSYRNVLVEIEPTGRFSARIPLDRAGFVPIRIGNAVIHLFAIPGDTMTSYIPMEGLYAQREMGSQVIRGMECMGKYGQLWKELNLLTNTSTYTSKRLKEQHRLYKTSMDSIHTEVLRFYHQDSISLAQAIAKGNYSDLAQSMARSGLAMRSLASFLRYSRQKWDQPLQPTTPDALRLIEHIDLEDLFVFFSGDVEDFLNALNFNPLFRWVGPSVDMPSHAMALYKNGEVQLEPKREYWVKYYQHVLEQPIDKRKYLMQKVTAEGMNELQAFFMQCTPLLQKTHAESLVYAPARRQFVLIPQALHSLFGIDSPLLVQLLTVYQWKLRFAQLEPEQAEVLTSIALDHITIPYMRKELMNQVYQQHVVLDSDQARPIPEGPGKAIFERLIAPHKGKYILVDFWATSCGPCLHSINNSHAVRQKLAKENYSFLFLTSEMDSDPRAYDRVMSKVQGDKHRLNVNDWNKIASLFHVNAIPRYLLINPQGKIVDAKHPGWRAMH